MRKLDMRHIAYHIIVGVYFVWLIVFCSLIIMAIINALGNNNAELNRIFLLWMLFNLIMGTVLFLVIRLFRKNNILYKIIFYSYFVMASASVTTVLIISRT